MASLTTATSTITYVPLKPDTMIPSSFFHGTTVSSMFSTLFATVPLLCGKLRNNSAFVVGFLAGCAATVAFIYVIFLMPPQLRIYFSAEPMTEELKAQRETFTKIEKSYTYKYNATGTVALELAKKVRVFCWIFTYENFHESRARHVRATWAQHCSHYLFFSSKDDPTLPAIDIGMPLGRKWIWRRTKWIVQYIYDNFMDEFDWIFRIDDDSYAVIENLRLMLLPYSSEEPIYFGHKMWSTLYTDYLFPQGGSGYVMSKSALKLLAEKGLNDSTKCWDGDDAEEDQFIAVCMERLGIKFGDSRDGKGRHRFFGDYIGKNLPPMTLYDPSYFWVHNLTYYPMEQGPECCSDYPISFHYTDARYLYLLEYMFYHADAYGARTLTSEDPKFLAKAEKVARENVGPDEPTRGKANAATKKRKRILLSRVKKRILARKINLDKKMNDTKRRMNRPRRTEHTNRS